jgi:hypothetical protein
MNIVLSALGHYEKARTQERLYGFDCVVGASFGTSTDQDSPNAHILRVAEGASRLSGRILIVDETLSDTFFDGDPLAFIGTRIIAGPPSTTMGGGLATWGTLKGAMDFMVKEKPWPYDASRPLRPLIVGQHYHVGRIAMQAYKLGMDPRIATDTIREFDRHSDQIWTRNLAFWLPREILGSFVLKKKGHL